MIRLPLTAVKNTGDNRTEGRGMNDHGCLIIGATGGIGRSLAARLAARGCRLYIHGRDSKRLETAASELRRAGASQVYTLEQELSGREDIHELISKIKPHREMIDGLVISYGPIRESSLSRENLEDSSYILDMNVLLPLGLIQFLAPVMASNGFGRIVVMGGTASDHNRAYRKIPVYGAAKYALNSIVRSASAEFAASGVTVNAVLPGYVKTEYYSKKSLDTLKKSGKLLEPEKISDIIEYLMSFRSSAVNGSIINAGAGLEW